MKILLCLLIIIAVFCSGCVKEPDANEADKVSIISIAPSSGSAGTMVVIKGAHFKEDPSENIVKFNNNPATVLTSSVDSLVVIAPANGTSGPVSVSIPGSVATGPIFSYTIDSVDVYVAAQASGVLYWKNGQSVYLASTQNNFGGAYSIAVSDTNVYVGGYTYFSIYPSFEAAYWKNQQKTILSSPDSAGELRALVLSGNNIYAGGSESYKPVYWKNGVKYSLPMDGGGYGRVHALAVNGNDVYAAGFEAGPNNEQRSVYWKNGVETVLGKNGIVDLGATSITTNGNDIYVCATDSGDAVYWKNGVRVVLEKHPDNNYVDATAITIMNKSVYVTGSFNGDAVYWKDGIRVTLPKRGFNARATAITFYQSDLYIGGRDGGAAVYWKNGVEVSLCCSMNANVGAIAVVKRQ
jgi:hypothetical protein